MNKLALSILSFSASSASADSERLFDACVGGLTAETGPGALVFSTVASGLYDDYLDYIMRRIPQKSRYSSRSETSVSKKIVFPIESATFVDSIGFYHNP